MCTVAGGKGLPAKWNNFSVIPKVLEQPCRIWTSLDEVYWQCKSVLQRSGAGKNILFDFFTV